jgi:hypothetical protein
MKHLVFVLIFLAGFGLAQGAIAEGLTIKPGDSIQKILEDRKGRQVTLRLSDGEEMTGTVRSITKELVLIGALAGRDFYDGIVEVEKISAVIVRVKD